MKNERFGVFLVFINMLTIFIYNLIGRPVVFVYVVLSLWLIYGIFSIWKYIKE
jgi:hypothetical protein